MPAGFEFGSTTLTGDLLAQEQALLQANFNRTSVANTIGFRPDSPIYIVEGRKLVGGLYLCAETEFDNSVPWGQVHYFFVDPAYRGQGIHSLLFAEAIRRARAWGFEGVYVNTDRHGLPELYERWGATIWKTIPKISQGRGEINKRGYNWLIYEIFLRNLRDIIRRYAAGVLVDIGCGKKPYAELTQGMVTKHIGVDHPETLHGRESIDVFATAYDTTLPDQFADTVLCTMVLEHLEEPQQAMNEMFRITKPGGYLILAVPLFWHLHEEPRDFFRYTKYGIEHLFKTAGYRTVEIRPLAGFWVTFIQEFAYYLESFPVRFYFPLIRFTQNVLQKIAFVLHNRGLDSNKAFTWCYMAVAARPGEPSV